MLAVGRETERGRERDQEGMADKIWLWALGGHLFSSLIREN